MVRLVVRVAVTLPIAQAAHESGDRVAQMERHRIRARALDVGHERAVRALDRVRLRRKCQVHRRLGERVVALRHPDEMHGLLCRGREDERLRVGKADILSSEDHQATGDEHRILARVDHPDQPVERTIRVGPAKALDEGGDGVVVRVTGAVIHQRASLKCVLHRGEVHVAHAIRVRHRGIRRQLERVEGDSRVAVRHDHERLKGIRLHRDHAVQAASIDKRALDDEAHVVLAQRLQDEHARSRQQRRDHLERRVLGRGADQRDVALLHGRQDGVLLGFVEAVDLVDEDDGALARGSAELARLFDHAPEIGDAGRHRRERDEPRLRPKRSDRCERRLPRARRAPEDHRRELPRVDRLAQHATRTDQMRLADVLVEITGPDARRQRLPRAVVRALDRRREQR